MVRRRAELCYHVKFSDVFWILSSRMTQMGGYVVLSLGRPGLHYHCRKMSLSLSSVDGSDDCY